jgi:hypothetical protein
VKEELTARPEAKFEAEIKANNKKFEVLQGTLVSRIDIHQARTEETIQEEIIAKMDPIRKGWEPV